MLRPSHTLLPALALLGAVLLWSSSFIAMKVGLEAFHPVVLMAGRLSVASFLFWLLRKNFANIVLHRDDWKQLLTMAFCEPCMYFIFEAYALQNTSASQAGMIVATLPIFVSVGAYFMLQERLKVSVWAGFMLAIAGVIWLSLAGTSTENAPNPVLGNVLEVLAMLSAAGYMLCAKKLSVKFSPLFITAMQAWVGCAFFVLLLPLVEMPTSFPFIPTACMIYLGAIISIAAYGLYNYAMSKLPAGQTSVWTNLIPVFTLIMGAVILGDTLTPGQYLASIMVLSGVLLSQWAPSLRRKILT